MSSGCVRPGLTHPFNPHWDVFSHLLFVVRRLSRWQKSTPTPESSLDVLFTFQRKGEVGFHCGVHTHISQVSL